jgi:hypothetical protein
VVISCVRVFASPCAPAWRLPLRSALMTVLEKSSSYCWGFGNRVVKNGGSSCICCSTVVAGVGVVGGGGGGVFVLGGAMCQSDCASFLYSFFGV